MIHLGYILQTIKAPSFNHCGDRFGEQPRICVIIDNSAIAHYFFSEDEKYKKGLWATYEGETDEVSNVIPYTEYKINNNVSQYAIPHTNYMETKTYPMQLCCNGVIVNKNGEQFTISDNETYVIKRLIKGEQVSILPYPINDIEQFERHILNIKNTIEYVSNHLQEIADSYHIEYETKIRAKIGDDDELKVIRHGQISYSDAYISLYMPISSKVVLDEGRYGDLSHDFTEQRAAEEMQNAKKRFLSEYSKFKHFSRLLYDYQISRQQEIETIRIKNEELLQYWKVNIQVVSERYDGRYSGVSSLVKEIEKYNAKVSK